MSLTGLMAEAEFDSQIAPFLPGSDSYLGFLVSYTFQIVLGGGRVEWTMPMGSVEKQTGGS